MKFVLLIDGSFNNFKRMIDLLANRKSHFIDTTKCDEEHEYYYLKKEIEKFSHSNNEVLLVRFSGRQAIAKEIGDETPEMVVFISYDKNSRQFVENPIEVFSNLLTVFKQGD